ALVAYPDADLHFGQKRHAVFAAGVPAEISFLTAIAFRFAHDTSSDVQLGDGLEHRLGAKGPNDDRELLHGLNPAAGDRQGLAADVTAFLAGQEQYGMGDVGRLAQPAGRDLLAI